ncbi:MAG: hypothetical protein QOD58_1548 [Mycobacterium sp.]|nr:hypothetical protein [Mycobacterium sp.]
MKKSSQIKSSQIQLVEATMPVIPERVVVAVADIAESMRKGLLVLAVGAGLQVMQSLDGVPQRAICAMIDSGRPRKRS